MESINHNWKTIYYHLRYEYEDSLSHQAVRILQIISRKKLLQLETLHQN